MQTQRRSPGRGARRPQPAPARRPSAARTVPSKRRPLGGRGGLGGLWVLAGITVAVMVFAVLQGPSRLASAPAPVPFRTTAPTPVGSDASWPSCAHPREPAAPAFAVVGVNNGTPGTRDPCLTAQLRWAAGATGGTAQPAIAYYVEAADPFRKYERKYTKPIWPGSLVVAGTTVQVPAHWGRSCTGSHRSRACAYVFGWASGYRDAHLTGIRHPGSARWWIDVETLRDWSGDHGFDQAIVEGMAAYLGGHGHGALGATAGLYSNAYFWSSIIGPLRHGSPLHGLPNWVPIGPGTTAEAVAALRTMQPFTSGSRVEVVQYVAGGVDLDVARAPGS